MSIGCVILAMILTNFTDTVINNNQQIIANKKPLNYPLVKDIRHFQLVSTSGDGYALGVEISFSEENDIQIKQRHEDNDTVYINIDFKQFNWQVHNDTLILNIDKGLSRNSYYSEILEIHLPKQLNKLSIVSNYNNQDYKIISQNEPIDLTVNTDKAKFMGNFKQLTVKQTEGCYEYKMIGDDVCFMFEDTKVDTLSMITPQQVVAKHNKKHKNKREPPLLFSMLLNEKLSAKQINLNVPKNSNIKITNLALLNKIKWEGVEE